MKGRFNYRLIFTLVSLVLMILGILSVAVYWTLLDRKIVDTFQTSRWSIPAKVYARPMELYKGAEINLLKFVKELDSLGYVESQSLHGTGQYVIDGSSIKLWHRGFSFWDIPEPSQKIELKFSWNELSSIRSIETNEMIPVMRMDPILIGKIHPRRFEDRELLRYDQLPEAFVNALIAVEDQKFFMHNGIDLSAIARAAVNNLQAKGYKQGASTLTQQLVKNFYLSPDRTLKRKVTEIMMSISLELRHSKEEILEAYINEVFLGQEGNRAIHGFGLASLFYFTKPLDELDTLEIATLVGLVKGPSIYNPRRHPAAALKRRNIVLDVMSSANLLNEQEVVKLKSSILSLSVTEKTAKRKHSSFMNLLQQQLLRDYSYQDLNESGLNIFTTLDIQLQNHAETVIPLSLDKIEKDRSKKDLQAGVVIADPRSGEILALVGDRYPNRNGFNRAVDALRPIGSVVKPFVYSYALSKPTSYSLASILRDETIRWTDVHGVTWTPKNYDSEEYGEVTLLDALTRSLNLAAISLGFELGLNEVKNYLVTLGAPDNLTSVPSMLLGAVEMSPLALTEMYTPLANQGFRTPLQAIKNVTTNDGKKLARYGLKMTKVMEAETAILIRHGLMRVVSTGTAKSLTKTLPAFQPLAGKTGTSNKNRDSWFVGFGQNLLGVVWVGRDDNSSTGLTGGSGALPLWTAIMVGTKVQPITEQLSDELVWANIDLVTGALIPDSCDGGELVPLHKKSWIRRTSDCTSKSNGAFVPIPAEGFLDRFKNYFD